MRKETNGKRLPKKNLDNKLLQMVGVFPGWERFFRIGKKQMRKRHKITNLLQFFTFWNAGQI